MTDVEAVIAVMGKPEDFAGENENNNTNSGQQSSASENRNYQDSGKKRRVFRDTDDKVLGGVCSGIANYFDIDPIWLRGAFAISFFAFGSGLLLYIILCIIIPKAKTTAEKLEMRGEKIDVNNIGKAVNEEFEEFKKRMKDFGDEVGSKENKERIKTTTQKAVDFTGDVLRNIFKIIGKIVAFFAVFIGIALLIGLLATIFGRGTISVFNSPTSNIHFSIYEFASAVLPSDLSVELIIVALILFIGVPLILIIYKGIKYLFGIKQNNKIVKYTANILWLCGLGLIIYIAIQIGNDFSEQASAKQYIQIMQPKNQTLYLELKPMPEDDIDLTYHHRSTINFGDWTMISKDENKFRLAYPTMDIVPSETDSFQLAVIKTADGYDKKEAAYRCKNISYNITQTDSIIAFNSYYDVANEDKLRAQDVKLILKVPMNKIIFISKRMEKIIFNIDNVNDALDSDMVNRRWKMTRQGLECIDCEGLENATKHNLIEPPAPPAPPVGSKK
jgi:phage shock protein PspC (stress-responsive transcriptional regulator)